MLAARSAHPQTLTFPLLAHRRPLVLVRVLAPCHCCPSSVHR
jgi:hypothetical protein